MMKRIPVSACCIWLLSFAGFAQKSAYSFSLFNHTSSLPGGSWTGAWHPGFDLGIQTQLKSKEQSQTFFLWKFGYYYHRLVHHGFQLYGEYNWRFKIHKHWGAGVSGGLGYLHTIENHEIFKLTPEGHYEKSGRFGKAHSQFSTAFNVHYKLSRDIQTFVEYRFRMVTPFVKKYVPLLPAVSLHAGVLIPITPVVAP